MISKLTLIIVLFYLSCPAQSDSILINLNSTIEDILEEQEDEETDNSGLYELIEYYIEHPLDINLVTIKELLKLPYLDPAAAELITLHRTKYGTYFSTNELYSVKGLPEDLVIKILPFLTTGRQDQARKIIADAAPSSLSFSMRNRMVKDIQERKGFRDYNFEGSPFKVYNRINLEYNSYIHMGLLTEKDAGEKSYYDYLSGYVSLTNKYSFNNIILGDYHVQFGQGLALWNSYGISKGSDAIFSTKKAGAIIKPASGTAENNFFRGAAFHYQWEHADIAAFYSTSMRDASLDSTGGITSVPLDGYHRTNNEILRKKSVKEKAAGMILKFSFSPSFSGGLLYYHTNFNHSFISYDIYDIQGNNFNYYSSYIDILIKNMNIYGELALNGSHAPAYLTGFTISPSTKFSYAMLLRNYPVEFNSLHGSSFGGRSGARKNEFGIYNGLRWRTSIGTVNFYFDQFKFPYATFTNPLPSEGNEFMLNFTTTKFRNCEIGIRVKVSNKETTGLIDGEEKMLRRLKQSLRLEYSYTLTPKLQLKTRIEYVSVLLKDNHSQEEGYLFYEDIRFRPAEGCLVYGRIIFFKTGSFNSAIYEYENGLTGMLNSIGLYAEGARFYIAARYRLMDRVSISLKYSETLKPKETSLGSGYQQIAGNIDNKIGIQADINF